jgi:hypothetical protein
MSYGSPPAYGGYRALQQRPPGYEPAPPWALWEHPSARGAFGLGLAAVFGLFGAVLGIPAILLGRSAERSIRCEPHLWRGLGTARAAIVLGWIAVFETAVVVAAAITVITESVDAGIAMTLVAALGLTLLALSRVRALPRPLALVCLAFRHAPLAIGVTLAGVMVGSGYGVVSVEVQTRDAQRCALARAAYADAWQKDWFAGAQDALEDVKASCHVSEWDIEAARESIHGKRAEARKRREAENEARAALVAAAKDQAAVGQFPEASKEVAAHLRKAQSAAWQGKWEDADNELTTAHRTLRGFEGTSVEQTKGFVDLTRQIAAQRRPLQPQLDRIEAKRRKEEAATALRAALRGPMPVSSGSDGAMLAVRRTLQASMHDPESYEHVRTTTPVIEGDYWVVVSWFRGKNVFGAKVLDGKRFYIRQGEVLKVSDVGGDGFK